MNKLPSSSCCIPAQNLSWSVLLEKLAKAIDFKAQVIWVLVKRKRRFLADSTYVSRILFIRESWTKIWLGRSFHLHVLDKVVFYCLQIGFVGVEQLSGVKR